MDNTPQQTQETFLPNIDTNNPLEGLTLPNIPDAQGLENSALSGIEAAVPGAQWVVELLKGVGDIPRLVAELIAVGKADHPLSHIAALLPQAKKFLRVIELADQDFWNVASDVAIGPIFTSMIEGGLGVSVSQFDEDELRAVQTVDTMVGFAAAMPLIMAGVNAAGTSLFGARWSHSIGEALKKIPEEMGLTWALGMVIDRLFEAALGAVLEEAVKRKTRSSRIEWQQVRVLLRQGLLNDEKMLEVFQNQGFRDEDIKLLMQLADQTIPIGDIAQLWYRDIIGADEAKKLIYALGFSDKQVEWLYELYIAKADNSASASYRSIARTMYLDHLITEEQYRAVLKEGSFPAKLIDEDIKAIQLEQSIGRVKHSVTEIKTRYLHRSIDADEATKELRELNYSDGYITEILQTWNLGPVVKSHGLSQSKILSYMVSGVLTAAQARPQLLATGLKSDTVDFLIAHPNANNGVHLHARSPGLVTQAFVDGAIPLGDLADAYKSAGVREADVDWYVRTAQYRLSHRRGSSTYTQALSAGDYRAAFKGGIIDFQQCVHYLEQVGYSPDSALLLTEITNKGPYEAPGQPAFPSLQAAIEFMREHGFTITPPMDPRLAAAESMLIQAGYSFYQPFNPTGGTGSPVTPTGPGSDNPGPLPGPHPRPPVIPL